MSEPDWKHHEQVAERLVRERAVVNLREVPLRELVMGPPQNRSLFLSTTNAQALVRIIDALRAENERLRIDNAQLRAALQVYLDAGHKEARRGASVIAKAALERKP